MDNLGSPPRGFEQADRDLIERMLRKGRTFVFAAMGSEELRYLDFMNANANVGGEDHLHILLREDPRMIEVWEEFLHGTQDKCGVIDRLGSNGAEVHVKRFMIRHRRLLGISPEDVGVLKALAGGASDEPAVPNSG